MLCWLAYLGTEFHQGFFFLGCLVDFYNFTLTSFWNLTTCGGPAVISGSYYCIFAFLVLQELGNLLLEYVSSVPSNLVRPGIVIGLLDVFAAFRGVCISEFLSVSGTRIRRRFPLFKGETEIDPPSSFACFLFLLPPKLPPCPFSFSFPLPFDQLAGCDSTVHLNPASHRIEDLAAPFTLALLLLLLSKSRAQIPM